MRKENNELKEFLVSELKDSLYYKEFKDLSEDNPKQEIIDYLHSKFLRLKKISQISIVIISIFITLTLFICLFNIENNILIGLIIFAITLIPLMVLGIFFNKQFYESEKNIFIIRVLRRILQ
ncbi:MAG: hypothetical protein WHS63_10330 [Tenuifilum sp.]|uniref:hypothetical protein n=1 Tax=Tenuifilum sp. TaxID=2760880 RepID=UPI0030B59C8A